jgi:hypothetical protein
MPGPKRLGRGQPFRSLEQGRSCECLKGSGVACMRKAPSISPTDRLDRDMYLVLEDFRTGPAWRETDEDRTDFRTLISDLLTGQYDHPLRVVAFNPLEGWSRDASADVAEELEQRVAEGYEVTEAVREFIERFTGRPIGVQLLLPLREF